MQIVFMVAEKPSLAQSIAKSLSFNQFSSRKGFNGACSVHEWTGTFNSGHGRVEQVRYKMTSVCGHVMALNFHHKYNNWDAVDPIELYSASTIKQEANPKLNMVSFLQKEAQGSSIVVLWLDCDKEGENICFEVLDSIEHEIGKASKIYRAKFSAITDQDIRGAMMNLQYPNKLEALSVDARQELDLRIGCAFTRFQTKYFQGKYGDLDSKLISFGPCQTPTLGFCVERHDKIQSFKPETFWVLKIMVACGDKNEQPLELDWNRGRIFDKAVANMFLGLTKQETKAEILGISVKESLRSRPQALNTVEMLRTASSGLGIGPSICMSIAEKLYTQGFISYPRTETTHYSDSFDLRGPLQSQRNNPEWGSFVKILLETGFSRPRKGTDAGDHPPITPMRSANPGELSGDSQRLYDYIARHYIATLMPDCRTEIRKITLQVGEMETFTLTGRRMIDPGFLSVMPWLNQDDVTLPGGMTVGQKLDIVGTPVLREGQTGPPDYLTEAELISKMEKHGIGTDASIPVHIQNIVERNYVQIIAGRKVQPTKLGIVLVHGYQQIDPELVLPHMRSAVEEQLDLIAKGKADYQAVVSHTVTVFSAKFKYFVENIAGMNELFDDSFSNLADTGKPLTRCGKCNRYMKLITTTPQRLHCGNCRYTCSLPPGGTVRQYKQVKCPLDGFELVVWSQGTKGKSFVLCPYCYTNPPFEDMQKQSGCNKCSHPDCSQSRAKLVVTACHECPYGLLLLDDSNAPRFKLQCNECSVLIMMEPTIIVVNVLTTSCEFCSSQHLQVKLNTTMMAELSGGKLTLWQFLLELLMSEEYSNLIKWTDRNIGEFILIQAEEVAKLWGIRKDRNHRMNYDKLSRALRYYYQKNIIKKVHGHKFVYRFVSLPPEMIPSSSNSHKTGNITNNNNSNNNNNNINISNGKSQCDPLHTSQSSSGIVEEDHISLEKCKSRSLCSNRNQQSISNTTRLPNKNLKKTDFNSTLSALFQAALLSLSGCNSDLTSGLFSTHKDTDQCVCSSEDNRNTPAGSRIFDLVNQTNVSPRHDCICQPELPIIPSSTSNNGLFIPGSGCSASHIQPLPFDRQSLLHFSRHSINMQRLSQEILLHSCNNSKSMLKPHLSNPLLTSPTESVENIIDSSHPGFWLSQFAQDLYNSTNHHTRISNNPDKLSLTPPSQDESDVSDVKIKTEKLNKSSPPAESENFNNLTSLFQQFVKDLESKKEPVSESNESTSVIPSHVSEYSHSDLANLIKSQLETHSSFVWMPIPVKFAEEIMKYCIKSGPEQSNLA